MKIGIDLRVFSSVHGGIQEYSQQILSRIVALAPEHEFIFFFSSARVQPPVFEWLLAPNARLVSVRYPNNALFAAARLAGRPHVDRILGGVDVFFSPHFFLAPLSSSCRRVTTFHDLSFEFFPEFFTPRQRLWHWLMNTRKTARMSDRIIAVSQSTADDIISRYSIDPARVLVIYSGSTLHRPSSAECEKFAHDHALPNRYIFSLANMEPRKNIIGLIRAFSLLKQHADFDDVHLLLAGGRGWDYENIATEIEHSPARTAIRYLGPVGDADRAGYYANATMLVYPSFFEGFGLPVIEAMACGTPVITSHHSSLAEVAGDAALLVDPYNTSDIARAMELILQDPSLRTALTNRGYARAEHFSWDMSAQKTLEAIVNS